MNVDTHRLLELGSEFGNERAFEVEKGIRQEGKIILLYDCNERGNEKGLPDVCQNQRNKFASLEIVSLGTNGRQLEGSVTRLGNLSPFGQHW